MSQQPDPATDITAAANHASVHGFGSLRDLVAARYPELRELARRIAANERPDATMHPTALVHEAYLRLIDQTRVTAQGTTFFRACFAQECRRLLVDHARARQALRRGGGAKRESLMESGCDLGMAGGIDLIEIHEAVETLAGLNERMARIVEMRVFAGMTVPECAEAVGVSARTVDKDWAFARAWLKK